ncbi:MAG: MBL fold metallo-hydrolase [Planctomycetes bacterium]|nr:MBL fold metallo-hydrolase [Planctomycetota bacterium]
MFLKQYYLGCLSHASYLIADEGTKNAVVVDPQRDIDQYVAEAAQRGFTIRHVFLTHFHADFVAGHLELAQTTGAVIRLGAQARADYAFTPMAEGSTLELGSVRIAVLETPGHTPEGISLVVYDLAKSREKPQAVLTGDTLFIGDVGRPDLMASVGVSAEQLAGLLYDSLHGKLLKLPDETRVYPAHGAGSACGKNLSKDTVSTIGAQRAGNYMLRPMSRESFVEIATQGQPKAPRYFGYDAQMNKEQRGTIDTQLARALTPLSLDALLEKQRAGALVLDTRHSDDFARGHLAGSVSVGLWGKFANWCGELLDPKQELVLVCAPGSEGESATRLGRIGFERVAGHLQGGFAAAAGRAELLASFERIDPPEMFARQRTSALHFLDVRNPGERDEVRIEGTIAIPLSELEARAHELPATGTLAVHCAGGYRSTIACSLLARLGRRELVDLRGGMSGWEQSGLPTTRGAHSSRA